MKPRNAAFLLLAVATTVALATGEIAVRLFARFGTGRLAHQIQAWDPFVVKVEPHGAYGYKPKPLSSFNYFAQVDANENAAGYRGPLVTEARDSNTLRVVLLGESTTHGFGVSDSQTIDAYLRPMMAARWPGRTVEVVNLAFDGYDAYQIWQRFLTDGVKLHPDAVILNTGVNDVRNARFANLTDPDPRTLIWEGEMRRLRDEAARGGPKWTTRIKHYVYLARVPGVIRQLRSVEQSNPRPAENVYPDAAAMFSLNVGRIADEAARINAVLLLSTPPSVLTSPQAPPDMNPRSYWIVNPAVTQTYRDTLAARLVSIAAARAGEGRRVRYVTHNLPPTDFLDDCHLTAEGNRRMAADFADALVAVLGQAAPARAAAAHSH